MTPAPGGGGARPRPPLLPAPALLLPRPPVQLGHAALYLELCLCAVGGCNNSMFRGHNYVIQRWAGHAKYLLWGLGHAPGSGSGSGRQLVNR